MLRLTAGISLREMARKLNVSPAYICQVEKGNRPPPTHEHIDRIAGILGISRSILQELIERPDPALMDILKTNPEAAQFIQAASDSGLTGEDFRNLLKLLNGFGVEGFRKLHEFGISHISQFQPMPLKPSQSSKSIQDKHQKIMQTTLQDGLIFPNLRQKNKNQLIRYLLKKAENAYAELDASVLYEKIMQRERESSSGLGNGVAVPHLLADEIEGTIVAIGKIPHGIDFNAVDDQPVRFISLILDNSKNYEFHLNLLAAIAGKFQHSRFRKELMKAGTKEKMFDVFNQTLTLSYL